MSVHSIKKFTLNYEGMNNKHVDYTNHKIMRELEFIKCGFICLKWDKTLKSGTKATFIAANEFEIMERLVILRREIKG